MNHALLMNTVWKITVGLSTALLAAGCASKAPESDSETHFVCRADEDCRSRLGEGYGCVESVCQKVVVDEAGPFEPKQTVPPADASVDASILSPLTDRPDGIGCFDMTVRPQLLGQNLYVLLDGSVAMGGPIAGSFPPWSIEVADGIKDFATSSFPSAVKMALQYFPLGSAPESCTAAYDQPAWGPTVIPTQASTIASAFPVRPASGAASPGPALKGGIDYLKSIGAANQFDVNKLVFITIGGTPECEPATPAEMATVVAAGLADVPRVSTYVIGLGGVASTYDEVAAAGGTNQAISISPANVRRQVNDAFDSIIGFTVPCEIDLSSASTRPTDLSQLDLSFELWDGGSSRVTRVSGPSDCASLDRDGWYVDNVSAPTKILLCPDQCAHPPSIYYHVKYGCL